MMHRFSKTLAMCIAFAAPTLGQLAESPSIVSVSGCAAVVSTTDICTTCVAAACVIPATVTAGCGSCADTPPTIYRSFPCDEGCNGLGCKTIYSVVTATDSVCAVSPTPTQDPGNSDGGEESTGVVTTTTSVSTAGAARLMPLRLW